MDTDFAPTGEARLRQILDAVVAEGDAAEHLGLEAKSDIDPSKKGVGIAKIAKFILGTSNRMPEVAAGHFKGYGVMVIGAEEASAPGIPKGDRKSTRLNSSHVAISYAVFCLKKKKTQTRTQRSTN